MIRSRLYGARIQVHCIHCSLMNFEFQLNEDIWIGSEFPHSCMTICDYILHVCLRYIESKLHILEYNLLFGAGKKCNRNAKKGTKREGGQIECETPIWIFDAQNLILKIRWHGASCSLRVSCKEQKRSSKNVFLVLGFDWLTIFMAVANLHLQHFSWLIMQMQKMCSRHVTFPFGVSSEENETCVEQA